MFIYIHMWHTVVVIETRCELVLDCMHEVHATAPGRRANRKHAVVGEPTSLSD